MIYQFNNEKKLQNLSAYGKDNLLLFESDSEKAEVYLKKNNIEKVIFIASGEKFIIPKKARKHIIVGKGNTKRDVYHYLKPGGPAPTMRLGITKHRGLGTWSSLPHKFELKQEPGFEEVFFYMLEGDSKRAIQVGQGAWFDGTKADSAWLVVDHSFSVIPMGYHPVVAEPGVHVSYVWVYLAKKESWEKI